MGISWLTAFFVASVILFAIGVLSNGLTTSGKLTRYRTILMIVSAVVMTITIAINVLT
jgi:hypothetical protein